MLFFRLIVVIILLVYVYDVKSFLSLSSSKISMLYCKNRITSSSKNIVVNSNSIISHSRFHHIKRKPFYATMERISIGDALTAEVNDVKGSMSDPIVEFTIKKSGLKATMPTKNLSMTERLALTAGSIMQVYVTKVEDDNIQVSLKPSSEQSMRKSKPINDSEFNGKFTKPKKNQIRNSADIPGVLLNNLKTGMKLEGKVASVSHYGAFIEAKIFRSSKGGSFKEIVGLLHKNDVFINGKKNKLSTEEVLTNGSPITVYVKEVWKNSGRFTLTMDPTISKAKILELKKITQLEGRERRRARRLRRQLANVAQGQTVTGVVQKVIPDGILVTINSLGALNVTGLISKRDLPKQFEVPAEMKESFQKQLLEQDFVTGRQITCGVLAVNNKIAGASKISAPIQYNVKLLYEEMGSMPVMGDDINLDGIDLIDDSSLKSIKDDETDKENDDEFASDVKEIYDELRGSNDYLPVDDLKAWEDIQDMLENGEITTQILDNALEQVHVGKNGMINFMQFSEIVEILQDELDGIYAANDDDDDDENDDTGDLYDGSSVSNKSKVTTKSSSLSSSTSIELPEDDWGDIDDMKEIAREIFDELREDSNTLSIANFKKWEDVQDMISTKVITASKLDEAIKKVGASKTINFEQFYQLVEIMDDLAAEADDNSSDFEVLSGEGFGKVTTKQEKYDTLSSKSSKLEMNAKAKDEPVVETEVAKDDEDDEDYDDEDIDEEEFKELIKSDFDQLKGKNGKVSTASFKKWEEVKNMIESGAMDNKTLDECVATIMNGKKGDMNFDQFYELVILLDETAEGGIDGEEEDEEENEEDIDDNDDGEDEEAPTEEELEAMAAEIFNELKSPKTGKVTVKKFKAWEGVKEVIESGELTKEALSDVLETVGVTTDISFEQFKEIMDLLEAAMMTDDDDDEDDEEEESPSKGFGSKNTKAPAPKEVPMSEEDEAAAVAKEIFNELRGKKKTLTVKAFKEWEELESMIEDGVIKHSTIEKALNKAGCLETNEITLKQFSKVMDYINENMDLSKLDLDMGDDDDDDEEVDRSAGFGVSQNSRVMKVDADDEDDDEDDGVDEEITEEEAAREIFDELKPKKSSTLPIAKFIRWGDVQELMQCGALSKDNLAKAIEQVGVTDDKVQLSFDMFFDLIQIIEEYIDQEKVPIDKASDVVFEKRVHVENNNDVDNVMNLLDGLMEDGKGDTKVSYVKGGKTSEGNAALARMQEDVMNDYEVDEQDDDEYDDDDEIHEMFEELSKGKSYITEKALRKWDELQEILEAGLVTKETIDDYFKRLNIKDGKVSLEQFTNFIEMLDTVLVDDEGNFLGLDDENSVDLSDIDDEL